MVRFKYLGASGSMLVEAKPLVLEDEKGVFEDSALSALVDRLLGLEGVGVTCLEAVSTVSVVLEVDDELTDTEVDDGVVGLLGSEVDISDEDEVSLDDREDDEEAVVLIEDVSADSVVEA